MKWVFVKQYYNYFFIFKTVYVARAFLKVFNMLFVSCQLYMPSTAESKTFFG